MQDANLDSDGCDAIFPVHACQERDFSVDSTGFEEDVQKDHLLEFGRHPALTFVSNAYPSRRETAPIFSKLHASLSAQPRKLCITIKQSPSDGFVSF